MKFFKKSKIASSTPKEEATTKGFSKGISMEDLLARDPISLNYSDVCSFLYNKTIIVSGGGGSIGAELCKQIFEFKPKKLIILDNNENGAYEVQQEILRKLNYHTPRPCEVPSCDPPSPSLRGPSHESPPEAISAPLPPTTSLRVPSHESLPEAISAPLPPTPSLRGPFMRSSRSNLRATTTRPSLRVPSLSTINYQLSTVNHRTPPSQVEVIIASIQDKARMIKIFQKYRPQIFFHAAAHKHVPVLEENPFEAVKNNVFGTLNCALLADKFKLEKFILISTDKAVNPISVMGATKRICEIICQEMSYISNTSYPSVRFGNVLGSNGSVIPLFKKQLEEGGPLIVTDPEVSRYFMTVNEAVQLILQVGAIGDKGDIFVLDMGEPIKIDDLAKKFIKLSGLTLGKDIKITYSGLRPGEKLKEEFYMQDQGLHPTDYDKIYISKTNDIDTEMFFEQLELLQTIVESENYDSFYKVMNKIVPSFNPPPRSVIARSLQ